LFKEDKTHQALKGVRDPYQDFEYEFQNEIYRESEYNISDLLKL